jgi:P27 family predicted phage terminase small subunit
MGRRGPAKTPSVIRLLRGNPGRRPIHADEPKPPALAADDPLRRCPRWLTGDARVIWERVTPDAIAIGLLTLVDLPAFEALCQSYGRWRQLERMITRFGMDMAIARGYVSKSAKERQLMLQFGSRFGFDPSSRTGIRGKSTMTPKDKIEAFRSQRIQPA